MELDQMRIGAMAGRGCGRNFSVDATVSKVEKKLLKEKKSLLEKKINIINKQIESL